MSEHVLLSKVLVLDESNTHDELIKAFCEERGLLPLRVNRQSLQGILSSNIDLGAVLLDEDYGRHDEEARDIAALIHHARRELPIFLSSATRKRLQDLAEPLQSYLCGVFSWDEQEHLKTLVDEYIFSLVYPSALVRGIAELSETVLIDQFQPMQVSCDVPYIVRDRLIYGEVFSLMEIESPWCRGYMMLQIEELPIRGILKHRSVSSEQDFREVNSFLGEVTNMIWGSFKSRFIGEPSENNTRIKIPLIINHKHKYISFGTENPQLCFRYTLRDEASGEAFVMYQRFIFNLSWSPEDFKEVSEFDELVSSGELEFF